jgi:hypothetical protein
MIKARFDPRAFEKLAFTEKQVRRVIFASHLDLDRTLRERNPFDTGFSASSWWAQADGSPGSHTGTKGGGRGSADPQTLMKSIGGRLTMANSAAYIRRLNAGYSPQAPAGWVNAVANMYQDFITLHAAQEKDKGL